MSRAAGLMSLRWPDFPARYSERVLAYLDAYRNDSRGRAAALVWYRASGRYEVMVKAILREHGLPEDLMWVAVVESRFDPAARSPAGAAGLWQFMPHTGRAYGLVIDRWVDERLDPVRSTHAAALLLSDLHTRFGSWELALAAYNHGYAGVLAAIRKLNTNDFHVLSGHEAGLPWETTLYVPKIVSLAILGKNASAFGLDGVDKEPAEAFEQVDVAPGQALSTVAVTSRAKVAEVLSLNPQYLAARTPPYETSGSNPWRVRVPEGSVASGLARSLIAAVQPPIHVLQHGETLDEVARKHSAFRADVARLNALKPNEALLPGTILLVPQRTVDDSQSKPAKVVVLPLDLRAPAGHKRMFYEVLDGDTVEDIARGLSVHVDELRGWNALDVGSRLHAGMTLVALVPEGRALEVPTLSDSDVRVVISGSDSFYEHVERSRGRVRGWLEVRPGDTWQRLALRTGMTVSQLERINERSRRSELCPGESLVAYVSVEKAWMVRPSFSLATQREEPHPPHPEDLPALPR